MSILDQSFSSNPPLAPLMASRCINTEMLMVTGTNSKVKGDKEAGIREKAIHTKKTRGREREEAAQGAIH